MSETALIRVGDVGTIIQVTVKDEDDAVIDISTCSVKQLVFLRPDATYYTRAAQFSTDGTNGVIQYTTTSADLTVAGEWKVQAYVELGTWKRTSSPVGFVVAENITRSAPT